MQALTLHPGEVTAKSVPASSTAQTTEYDSSRDATAQPSNAWFDHSPAYRNGYQNGYNNSYNSYNIYGHDYPDDHNAYGTYDEENTEHPIAYDPIYGAYGYENIEDVEAEWDQASPAGNAAEGGAEAAASAGLCSQYQATGQCPKGPSCRLTHGNLCEVCLLLPSSVSAGCCLLLHLRV